MWTQDADVNKGPGLGIPFECHASYTPALEDEVEMVDNGVVNKIADGTTSSTHLGKVAAIAPDGKSVTVQTFFRKYRVVKSAAATTRGPGIWEGQKARSWVEGTDAVALLAAANGMMVLTAVAAADLDVSIGIP